MIVVVGNYRWFGSRELTSVSPHSARNLARQEGRYIEDFDLFVVDLADAQWDWTKGEPPATEAAYYARYCKTFSRMGGRLTYLRMDNRVFFLSLLEALTVNKG